MRLLFASVLACCCAALASPALAQTTINVPSQVVTVLAPSQIVAIPATSTTPATTYTVPSYSLLYTVPAYTMTIPVNPPPPPPPPAAPTVTLSAAPVGITAGTSSTLTWLSTNATSCAGVGTATSGTASVTPTVTTSYSESCTGSGGTASASTTVTVTAVGTPPMTGNCEQQLGATPVVFCDTFDVPFSNGVRQGQLDADVWGVSRLGGVNFGQSNYNTWNQTAIVKCDGTTPTVTPPNDVIICNGQLREALNDNGSGVFDGGGIYVLGMYPKQPFDFAGRTGTVSFDVSNDSEGSHTVWPEFW